jgi:ribosomal protein L30E
MREERLKWERIDQMISQKKKHTHTRLSSSSSLSSIHFSSLLGLFITAKLIILSNNCPALRKSELEYYAMLAKCGVHHYSESESNFVF